MKTAALYIRVSTDDQAEYSPDAQKRLLLDYAKKNNMLVQEEYIFIETGISGREADKRPEFQKMISMAKEKEHLFDIILVWKYSRFARNQEESIVYKSLLKKNDIDVISISEPLIDGPFGSLIERIIEWMDEYYSIRLSGEVKRGMTEKALKGEYQAGAPFGYVMQDGNLQIDKEKAEVIKKIFDMYVFEAESHFSIAKKLNEIGVLTNRGNPFQNRTVKYILQNPTYKGYVRWNPEGRQDLREQKYHSSNFIVKKGSHEPIISKEIWDKANERIEKEYRPRKAKPSTSLKYWLGGVLTCSDCGSTLVSSGGENREGFQCHAYASGVCKVSHYVSKNKIETAVLKFLKELSESEFIGDYEILQPSSNTNDIDLINNALDKINIKEQRIKDAYVNGIDSIEEYRQNKEKLQKEKLELQNKLNREKVAKSKETDIIMMQRLKNVYKVLISEKSTKEKKNVAIKSIVKKIIYDKKHESIRVYLYLS